MRCLVTGGAGFIGSNLVDTLIEKGWPVTVIDNLSTGDLNNINTRSKFYNVDIVDYKRIEPLFKGIDYVFHLAALPRIQPSFEDPILHENVNVVGTINCFQAARRHGVKKFVFSSSSACYGNPTQIPTTEQAAINCLSPYALQKYSAEQYCLILGQRFNLPVVILRYFNVYGPRSFSPRNKFNAYSSVIGIFHNQKKSNRPLTITGNGEQSRDFVHVYDVAQANLCAIFDGPAGKIFNIGFGKTYTINEIARMFSDRYIYIPERKGEAMITLADIGKAKKELNWQPTINLKKGLRGLDERK
jgi:UDP-glucose 4-epimerase